MKTLAFLIFQVVYQIESSKVYEELQSKYSENDLLTWEPPEEYRKNFTYILSGYDYVGRPLWIQEWGRWDIRKFIEKGGESLETLNKFVDQVAYNGMKSADTNLTSSEITHEFSAIIDLEGYNYSQFISLPTLRYYLKTFAFYSPIVYKYIKTIFVVNESAINFVRPVLGKMLEKIEIHGTNKAKWKPRLLQHFPRESLPERYGGSKDFRPVKAYGK